MRFFTIYRYHFFSTLFVQDFCMSLYYTDLYVCMCSNNYSMYLMLFLYYMFNHNDKYSATPSMFCNSERSRVKRGGNISRKYVLHSSTLPMWSFFFPFSNVYFIYFYMRGCLCLCLGKDWFFFSSSQNVQIVSLGYHEIKSCGLYIFGYWYLIYIRQPNNYLRGHELNPWVSWVVSSD